MAFFQGLLSKLISSIGTAAPALPLGQYNASGPTLADGEGTNLQMDSAGAVKTTDSSVVTALASIATEATLVKVYNACGGSEQPFESIFRNWSNSSNDTDPPTAAIAVAQNLGGVEIVFNGSFTFGGTVAATEYRFKVYKFVGTTAVLVDTWTELASELALAPGSTRIPVRQYFADSDGWAIVQAALDGTSPTITGTVSIRPVSKPVADSSTYRKSRSTGNQVVEDVTYDGVTGTNKVSNVIDLYPALNEPTVVSEASRATGTHYAPSSDGIDMGTGYKRLTVRFAFAAAGTSSVVNDIEATIDGTNWDVVTLACVDADTGLSPTATSLDSTAGAAITKAVLIKDADHFQKFRLKSVVTNGPTGAHTVSFRRASDKS